MSPCVNTDRRFNLLQIYAWTAVAIALLENVVSYLCEYFAGTQNTISLLSLLPCGFLLISWAICGLLVLKSAIMLLGLIAKKSLTLKKAGIGVIPLVLVVSVSVLSLPTLQIRPAGAQVFLKGFEKWVKKQVDTDSIQLWLQSADEKYWESGYSYGTYPAEKSIPENFPDFLKNFGPQYMFLERSELDGSKIIRFEWGGGMFHWSLVVGGPNMKMPEQTVEWFSDYDVEFRRILKPGVYVYSRG